MDATGRVSTVMVDTVDVETAVTFWATVLGLETLYRTDTYAYLSPLADGGPHLAFQKVSDDKVTKNRLHLDVRVADRETFAESLVGMGATVIGHHQEGEFPPWTIMADPLGNEFCIYSQQEDAA